jgi:hypothetical protein
MAAIAVGGISFGCALFAAFHGTAGWVEHNSAIALETGARVEGRIVSITRSGVSMQGPARPLTRGTRGIVEFAPSPGSLDICRTRVVFGTADVTVGQSLTIVPSSRSCDDPVIGLGREPAGPYFLSALINGVLALALGVIAWLVARPRPAP